MKSKKKLALASAIVAVAVFAAGATLAWLTDKTETITNTFTVGNVDISLEETTSDYKMVPGNTIAKDPKITVEARSEACWLFVKIDESTTLDDYISYGIADGWTALNGVNGVYYREVSASASDQDFVVLKTNGTNSQVLVKNTVTKDKMEALSAEGAIQPTLSFTAYAVQKDNIDTAAAAWAEASK